MSHVRRRTLLVGDEEQVAELRHVLGFSRNGIPYEFVGVAEPSAGEVAAVLESEHVDELILADPAVDERRLLEIAEEAYRRGVRVRDRPAHDGAAEPARRVRARPGSAALRAAPARARRRRLAAEARLRPPRRLRDRADRAAAVGADRARRQAGLAGPVLYRSRRSASHEQEFGMFKFRTMRDDAEERQGELELANEAPGRCSRSAATRA